MSGPRCGAIAACYLLRYSHPAGNPFPMFLNTILVSHKCPHRDGQIIHAPKEGFMKARTLLALAAGMAIAAPAAEARITRVEIDATRSQSPSFGGYAWPGVGQYEKIVGKAFGEVNPHDRQNRVIVDIEFAPTNARGNVEYAFNFYILKPIDLSRGADKMMYEPPNRGGKTWAALGRVTVDTGANGDDPGSAITNPTVLANSFLMPRGYSI